MPAHIGRLVAIGIGKESTAGTAVTPTDYMPVMKSEMNPKTTYADDTGGYQIIDKVFGTEQTTSTSETTLEGVVREVPFGHILMACFGTVAAPSLVETGVYKHNFTRKNDNQPITYTFTEDGPAGTSNAPYQVLDKLDIEAKAGDYVKFSAKYVGGTVATTTDVTPSFTTTGPFIASGVTLKYASNVAGLSSGTTLPATSFKVSIDKNPELYMALGSLNVNSIHNTEFTVKGDIEVRYDDQTYRDMILTGAKKAISIVCAGQALIGATKKGELGITLANVVFTEWKRSNDADKLVTQTLGFTGTFSLADAMTMSAYIQNTRNTTY